MTSIFKLPVPKGSFYASEYIKVKSQLMYDDFKTYLQNYVSVTEDEWQLIKSRLYTGMSRKGDILLRTNQVCQNVYFIVEGCMRTFYVQENGKEATRLIICERETMAPLASFISQKPSDEALQALEDCKYLRMSRKDFYELLEQLPIWETYFRRRLEKAQILNIQRMESLLNMDAKQRYAQLLQDKPNLIQRLPNYIIASYLGITQESLSRIKSKK